MPRRQRDKSQIRNPGTESNPKAEMRNLYQQSHLSSFGFRPSFGLRPSVSGLCPPCHADDSRRGPGQMRPAISQRDFSACRFAPRCHNRSPGMGEVTRILEALGRGEIKAADELLPLVYAELRALAAEKMARAVNHNPAQTTSKGQSAVRLAGM